MQKSSQPFDPPVYFCPRAKSSLTLDGDIRKEFWKDVPFTSDFVDISGPSFPTPRFRTRAKLCWDDENLYIAALLEGDEIWATLTERDCVIYLDNDFEVFIDPNSTTHDYLEFEMNALNTQWDLLLTRPYRDGGRSVSCWDIKGLESAVHIEGTLNRPGGQNKWWSVEIKLPFTSLFEGYELEKNPPDLPRCYQGKKKPAIGDFWRMNFSRVNWPVDKNSYAKLLDDKGEPLPEDNWVWAPTGMIDIHCPEYWSFVFFTEKGETFEVSETERKKLDLRRFYYDLHNYYDEHGEFPASLDVLGLQMPPFPIQYDPTSHGFELSCETGDKKHNVILFSNGFTCSFETTDAR